MNVFVNNGGQTSNKKAQATNSRSACIMGTWRNGAFIDGGSIRV